MKEPWKHDQWITLVRNDSYFGEKAHLDEVAITILPEPGRRSRRSTRASSRASSTTPASRRRSSPRPRRRTSPRAASSPSISYGINYLLVNVVNPPLNKADARKAISLAIDRDAIIDGVFKGFQTKATSIIPPPMKAYYQAGVCDVCDKPDIPRAKDLAAKAGHPAGHQGQPGLQHRRRATRRGSRPSRQQLETNLGLKVDLQPSPFAELLKKENGGQRQRPLPGRLERRLPERRELPLPAAGQGVAAAGRQPGPLRQPRSSTTSLAAGPPGDRRRAAGSRYIKAGREDRHRRGPGPDPAVVPRASTGSSTRPSGPTSSSTSSRTPRLADHQPEVRSVRQLRWAGTSSGGCCR